MGYYLRETIPTSVQRRFLSSQLKNNQQLIIVYMRLTRQHDFMPNIRTPNTGSEPRMNERQGLLEGGADTRNLTKFESL